MNPYLTAIQALENCVKDAMENNVDASTQSEIWRHYQGIKAIAKQLDQDKISLDINTDTITGINFNGVLINFYRNGLDSMGLHSDDEPELGERPIIASVSFGAARNFRLKRKDRLYNPISILLGSGSLLLMSGDTQKYWSHELPKTKKSIGPRINLTLRKIIV